MENLNCQDILRHDSPFRQGVCQSSTALWDCWTQSWCLWPSNQRCLWLLSQFPRVSSFSLGWFTDCQGPASFCICPFFLSPAGSAPIALSVPGCVIPPAALSLFDPCGQRRAPLSGPAAVVTPPHCVLPEASARTRCRLMASSRNPATFSLSSCTGHRTFLRLDMKCQYYLISSCFVQKITVKDISPLLLIQEWK